MTALAHSHDAASPSRRARTARVVVLFLLLVVGALLVFNQSGIVEGVRSGGSAPELVLVVPGALLLLALVVAIDAIWSAVRRGFFTGRSLLQLVLALVLTGFVGSGAWREYQVRRGPTVASVELLETLSRSSDPRVRALVMEVAARREEPKRALYQLLKKGLDDPDPLVWHTVIAVAKGPHADLPDVAGAREAARADLERALAELDGE